MAIKWEEGQPSDSDHFSGFAAEVRSLKSSLALALSNALYWPGSGGGDLASAGSVKAGMARASVGTEGQRTAWLNASDRIQPGVAIFLESDTSRLWSATTNPISGMLGSARGVEASSFSTGASWVVSRATSVATDEYSLFDYSNSRDSVVKYVSWGVEYQSAPYVQATLSLETFTGGVSTDSLVKAMLVQPSSITVGGAAFVLSVVARGGPGAFPGVGSVCTAHLLAIAQGKVAY